MMSNGLLIVSESRLIRFLNARKEKFPNVSIEQRNSWTRKVAQQIDSILSENDIFYDNMPEDIVEK